MTIGTVQDTGRTGAKPRDPKSFIDPQVWERQIGLLVRDHPFDTVMAERLFGHAVAYLITAPSSGLFSMAATTRVLRSALRSLPGTRHSGTQLK